MKMPFSNVRSDNVNVYSVYIDLLYNALYHILPWRPCVSMPKNYLPKIDKTLNVIMRKKNLNSIFPAYLYTV